MAQRVHARDCSFTTMGLKEPSPLTSLSTVLLRTAGCTQRADGSAFTLRLSGCYLPGSVCGRTGLSPLGCRDTKLKPFILVQHPPETARCSFWYCPAHRGAVPTNVRFMQMCGSCRCAVPTDVWFIRCAVHTACHGYFPDFP